MSSVVRRLVAKASLPPCALRIHPSDPTAFYIGTYKLVKDNQRYGTIEIWKCTQTLQKVNEIAAGSAILDLKFDPFDESRLISVHSTGNLKIWKLTDDHLHLRETLNYQAYEETTLITAANFHPTRPNVLTLSTTTGVCSVVILGEKINQRDFDTTHDLECWFSTFGCFDGLQDVIFSGGDDRNLIAHDNRMADFPVWKTDRLHDAGIVSVLTATPSWNSAHPYTIWTGSYDDHLNLLDLRVSSPSDLIPGVPPRVLQRKDLGGGVWRLIPGPHNDGRVLCCAMYAGCRMLKSADGTIIVEQEFKEDHDSMVYGGDWTAGNMVTCSFYDQVIQVWDGQ
ncbi:hypothetical protein OGATHE_006111 [Ogataea polymorpha]|uniref:methylated diphthine methylhydrolase n=1 Tax=Ogataea polymorpha TaxID=460523 RepID=A0A9P8NTS1_9ASCO|nr:hypothetical protein OGATHE_006111 [Ogataea polymorpha]